MKVVIRVLAVMAGFVLASNAQAFTIEDDFDGDTLNPRWNTTFNGGAPAQVDLVSGVKVTKVIVIPSIDGGQAVRVRGENEVSVSFGTAFDCGVACTLSFNTLFNLKDTDPFIDFGQVFAKSSTETLELFYDDVHNTDLPTWHSIDMNLAPGHWDFSVVHTNGLDTGTSSEMYLDNFSVIGAVTAVPVPGSVLFGLSGLVPLVLKLRRKPNG